MNRGLNTTALITGLPRSGTTMTCYLLNKLPNSVALHEPLRPAKLKDLAPEMVSKRIVNFVKRQRQSILEDGVAISKSSGGQVPTNPLADGASGEREKVIDGRNISVGNITDASFRLYIKHPSLFTSLLPQLVKRFECYATVRNPLSVLLSWRSANMSVTKGRVPAAEQFDPDLKQRLDAAPDVIARHFILLDYFFGRYAEYLPGRVIKYEDTVATGGKALQLITPDAALLDEPLSSRNSLALAENPDARDVLLRLCDSDNACWRFYERAAVMAMFDET